MASWVYDEKFLMDVWFLFGTLPFIAEEDDDLEHPAQEQEERRTTTIGFEFPRCPQDHSDHVSSDGHATSYNKSDWHPSVTNDQDSIDDYPIIWVNPWWDPNNEAQKVSMVGRSNQEVIHSSSKYPRINGSTMTKCGFFSSSHSPFQLGLQHDPTARSNLYDRSRLSHPNRCTLSDQQAVHHHLRKNIFKPNQQGTASPNKETRYPHPQQVWVFNSEL
jgi:hypothetical protein